MMSTDAPINVEAVLGRTRVDLDLLIAMIAQSIPHLQARCESMYLAIDAGDTDQVARDAHAIKGSAGTLGMAPLQALAVRLERLSNGLVEGDLREGSASLQAEMSRVTEHAVSLGAEVESVQGV